jgi:hypothetical protein
VDPHRCKVHGPAARLRRRAVDDRGGHSLRLALGEIRRPADLAGSEQTGRPPDRVGGQPRLHIRPQPRLERAPPRGEHALDERRRRRPGRPRGAALQRQSPRAAGGAFAVGPGLAPARAAAAAGRRPPQPAGDRAVAGLPLQRGYK